MLNQSQKIRLILGLKGGNSNIYCYRKNINTLQHVTKITDW